MKRYFGLVLVCLLAACVTDGAFAAGTTVNATWTPPTQNVDGTALTDLSGYVLRWYVSGTDTMAGSKSITAPASAVSFTISCGKFDFGMTAKNVKGAESNETSRITYDTGVVCPAKAKPVTNFKIT